MDGDSALVPLPAFLDPLLDYLAQHVPSPVYDVLITALSHLLAIVTSIVTLGQAVLTSNGMKLDAQTVIPPLISLLAAYLALLSLYRTTSWMFRTAFWVAKWGAIAGIMWNGYSWMTGQSAGGALGRLALNMLGLNGGRPAGQQSTTYRTDRERARAARPRPWESFDSHRTWQEEQDEAGRREDLGEAGRVIEDIVAAGGQALREAGFTANIWGYVKTVVDGLAEGDKDGPQGGNTRQSTRRQPARKTKKNTNSRDN